MRRTAADAAETRARILDAGLAVFAARGFAATRLEEVAERAGVTRGAFYHHFHDKNELWVEVLAAHWEAAGARLFAPLATRAAPRAKLAALVASFVRLARTDEVVRSLLAMSTAGDASTEGGLAKKGDALARWAKDIEPVFEAAGKTRDARRLSRLLVTILVGIGTMNVVAPASAPAAADAELVAKNVLDGLL